MKALGYVMMKHTSFLADTTRLTGATDVIIKGFDPA